jgi:hypothetical protein
MPIGIGHSCSKSIAQMRSQLRKDKTLIQVCLVLASGLKRALNKPIYQVSFWVHNQPTNFDVERSFASAI